MVNMVLLPSYYTWPPFITDARECILCTGDFWSNAAHDACVPKLIEFLAFGEPLGITLIAISAFGALVTIAVGVRKAKHKIIPERSSDVERKQAKKKKLNFLFFSPRYCLLCTLAPLW